MIFARQSTAIIVTVGPVLDAAGVAVTDGVVGDFKISKNGGAPAALNGSATLTHRNTGHYSLSLTATDVNTVGTAEIVIDDTVNACPMKEIQVVEPTTYDVLFADAAPGPASPTNITAGTVTTATNVTTVNGLAAGVITAAAVATGAIDADAIAADAVAEIADGVWDEDATGHQTQGTFGQAIGDPVADTNTIFKAVVTDATGATVGVDAAAILADTGTDGVVLANDAITAAKIAANAIGSSEIADGAITAAKFGAGAIDATAIANGAIDAATFAAGAIDAAALAADAGTEIGTAVWATVTRSLTVLDEDSTTLDLDATIRAAVGLTAANLDTQIGDLPTNAELATALDPLPTAAENATAVLTTQMTEAYAADGAAPTLTQAVMAIQQFLQEKGISGTTLTVKKLDGTTSAMTFTLDSDTAPTSITRAT